MKEEYNFENGIRGKFYKENAQFNLPIYLDKELQDFLTKITKDKNTSLTSIVNKMLKKDKELIELGASNI
jgi:hypothetical protein